MGNPEDPQFELERQQAEQWAKWRRPDGMSFGIPSANRTWGLIIVLAVIVLVVGGVVSIVRF